MGSAVPIGLGRWHETLLTFYFQCDFGEPDAHARRFSLWSAPSGQEYAGQADPLNLDDPFEEPASGFMPTAFVTDDRLQSWCGGHCAGLWRAR